MPTYAGINGVVRKLKEWPVGVAGVVRQQKEVWAGIDGVSRKIFVKEELVTVTLKGTSRERAYVVIENETYYGSPNQTIQVKKGTEIEAVATTNASGTSSNYIRFNGTYVGKQDGWSARRFTFQCESNVEIYMLDRAGTVSGIFYQYGTIDITGGT